MDNCLVKKYKGTVDNNNLLKINEAIVKIKLIPNQVAFRVNTPFVCNKDLWSYDHATQYPAGQIIDGTAANWYVRIEGSPEEVATIKILNKYAVTDLWMNNPLEEDSLFVTLHSVKLYESQNMSFPDGWLQETLERSTELYLVEIRDVADAIDLSGFNFSEVTSFKLTRCTDVTLNISQISAANYLQTMSINSGGASMSNITGSIEQFIINTMGNASNIREEMSLELPNTAVTFNNTSEHNSEYKYYVQKNSGNFVVRKNNSSGVIIGTYNGSTWNYS